MSKKVLPVFFSFTLAAGIFAGCTPNTLALWCSGLGEGAAFSLEYAAANTAYDGQSRTFTIKDDEDFAAYVQSVEEFVGTYPLADGEGEAYVFESGGQTYYCTKTGSGENSYYSLASCSIIIYTDDLYAIFAYPPAGHNCLSDDSIATIRDWSYFAQFYISVAGAQVDEATQTIELACYSYYGEEATGSICLTYADGALSYAIYEHE